MSKDKIIDIQLYESIKKDYEMTAGNYAQLHDRLLFQKNITNFFLIYYSIIGIVTTLIMKYFNFNDSVISALEFSSIIISVILLTCSILIGFANYSHRIEKAIKALDFMKRCKKELIEFSEIGLNIDDYKKRLDDYHKIVDEMELRTEIDFYKSCKLMGNNKLLKYFPSYFKRFSLDFKIFLRFFLILLLFILPIALYIYILLI